MEKDETKLFPLWKELVRVALTWNYEETHSHNEIAEILGVEPQSDAYFGIIQTAKDRLILHGILLVADIGKGYYIVEPDKHDEESHKDLVKSRKFHERNLIKLAYANVDEMSEDARKRHDLSLIKSRAIYDMTTPGFIEITNIVSIPNKLFRIKELKPSEEKENESH